MKNPHPDDEEEDEFDEDGNPSMLFWFLTFNFKTNQREHVYD
jgi:hypothetical protein